MIPPDTSQTSLIYPLIFPNNHIHILIFYNNVSGKSWSVYIRFHLVSLFLLTLCVGKIIMMIGKVANVLWKTRPGTCFGDIASDLFTELQKRKKTPTKKTTHQNHLKLALRDILAFKLLPQFFHLRNYKLVVTIFIIITSLSSSSSPSSSSWLLYNHQLTRKCKSPLSVAPLLRLRPRDFLPTRRRLRQRRPEK